MSLYSEELYNTDITPTAQTPASAETVTFPSDSAYLVLGVACAAASSTLTVASQANPGDARAEQDKTVIVPAGGTKYVRVSQAFADASRTVHLSFSNTSGVTVTVAHASGLETGNGFQFMHPKNSQFVIGV